ncbi:oligosaccharide flippase family protein [Serpentinicella sp. ANB-PHB4]|uniref:oligosaccharide flippase family protein n=1 Tax=Serpentinicella sp. ANB-PHB4 TaxID=3074076 RepID=UPI00285FAA8B|nr:oligosaccharide flippase family protein [Serpentinicella sp. ANB-PHB4]MDR5658758.1 oligosaccharide flippase family protein [Serpentinicella sp. ANB-PHB4]
MTTIIKQSQKLYREGFFHVMLGNTLVKAIAFISSIVIVRLVDKQSYAYLAYVNNLYAYIALFSGFGMSSALLKYCSSTADISSNKAFFYFAIKYGSIFQFVLTIVLLGYMYIAEIPFPEARSLALLFILMPVLTYVLQTTQSYVRSQRNNKLYAQIGVTQTIIVFIFSILFVLTLGIKGVPMARYLGVTIGIIVAIRYVRNSFIGSITITLSRSQIKSFILMGKSLMIANLFSMIMPLNELFLINHLLRDEAITANYKIAMLIPSQLSFITGSIMVYYFPIIAQMTKNKKILKTSINVQLLAASIIGCISLIGYIFTPYIIEFVYGDIYSDAMTLSRLFWLVYAINSGFRMIPMNIMPAIGRVKFNERMAIITSIVHLLVDYLLLSKFGISGAIYATLSVYLISGTIYWYYLIKICHADADANIVI